MTLWHGRSVPGAQGRVSSGGGRRVAPPSPGAIERWLQRYGTHTASHVLSEGNARLFWHPSIEGFIGWERRYGCPVIAGDPVCEPGTAASLIAAFRRHTWPRPVVAYAVTPGHHAAFRATGFRAVPIGAEATFDPIRFTLGGGARAVLRAAVNHAVKAGVTVTECRPGLADAAVAVAELQALSREWLAAKGGDELGLLLGEPVFDRPTARRMFVARAAGGRAEGFLVCAPVPARNGWYLDITRRRADAVRGTMELLTVVALRTFGGEGSTFASMGLSPLARLDLPEAPPGDSAVLRDLMLRAFAGVRSPYDYRALHRYKEKYAPDAWEYRYLCYSGTVAELGIRVLLSRLLRQSARLGSVDDA